MKTYIHPTQEAGKAFYQKQIQGPVTMLNLLRFRDVADYSESPHLSPEGELAGKAAYQLYMQHTLPFMKEAGGEVIFYGAAADYLIGPSEEKWDVVLIVRYPSAGAFLAFAQNEAYLKGIGHRTAALADSRLLPMSGK